MKQFNYKGNKFKIGLQTILDEEYIVTKGYELKDEVYFHNDLSLYIGTNWIQDNEYDITINNNLLVRSKSNYEQNGLTYEKLIEHLEEICNEREERVFICDDFHIKLWQTEDEIGAETVFVKEGFEYDDEIIAIDKYITTRFWNTVFPIFGMKRKAYSLPKKDFRVSLSRIEESLQQAVEYSKKQNAKLKTNSLPENILNIQLSNETKSEIIGELFNFSLDEKGRIYDEEGYEFHSLSDNLKFNFNTLKNIIEYCEYKAELKGKHLIRQELRRSLGF